MRILVTGATGFLGRTLCDSDEEGVVILPTARRPPSESGWLELDVTSSTQVYEVIGASGADWVINTAAVTGVDGCEDDPEPARRVHVEAAAGLSDACASHGCGLVYLSTNYVFDGEDGPYSEADVPRPPNVYGATKLEGERAVLEGPAKSVVVRTAVLFGYHPACGPNFLTWAAEALSAGERLRIVTDEWANPTPAVELSRFLIGACRDGLSGLYHAAGRDFLTRYEMIQALCDEFGFDEGLVTPVTSADLGQRARRPLRAGLLTDKASATGHLALAPFGTHLAELRRTWPEPPVE